jgi:predicted nuclease with TOPRIM domain
MRDKLMSRLEELKTEFQTGQAKLRDLEINQSKLRETLLRISGAIQVLEETLQPADPDEVTPSQTSPPANVADAVKE